MLFKDYEKRASGYLFAHQHIHVFLPLGLCEEAGEVAGKIKKIYRDKDGVFSKEDNEAIALELGDVLFYIAMLGVEIKWGLVRIANAKVKGIWTRDILRSFTDYEEWALKQNSGNVEVYKFALRLCSCVGKVAEAISSANELSQEDQIAIMKKLNNVLHYVTILAREFGYTLEQIATMNLEKCERRKQNGTIHGSGDNR